MLDILSEKEAQNILNMKNNNPQQILNEETKPISLVNLNSLPSGFKGYPEGTKISYEPITLGELEALNTGEVDITRAIAMLLKSIHCNTLPSEELYYWDVMYIGIQRKLLAFGDTKGVIYATCPKCGNIVEKEFDYTELEFKEISAPALPVITTVQNKEVEIHLLTMKDFLQIDVEKGELDVYARMLNLPYEEAFQLISTCYGRDAKKIKFIDKQLDYGLKPFIVTCNGEIIENDKKKKCKEKVRVEVRSPFEVVFPEGNDGDDFDLEIRYGR
jgi:hypothetical protein